MPGAEAKKPFRTTVGQLPSQTARESLLIIDTNNSSLYHGCFAAYSGEEGEAAVVFDYIRSAFEPYSDCYQGRALGNPASFIKNVLTESMRRVERFRAGERLERREEGRPSLRGVRDDEGKPFSLAMVVVVHQFATVGRINNLSAFLLKERKFRQLFGKKAVPNYDPEIESFDVKEGSRLLLATDQVAGSITRLELKNILNAQPDVEQACSRLAMFVERAVERDKASALLLGFEVPPRLKKKSFQGTFVAMFAAFALVVLTAVFMGDVAQLVQSRINNEIDGGKVQTEAPEGQAAAPKDNASSARRKYRVEMVYSENGTPYDLTLDERGHIYLIDDKLDSVLVYDPVSGIKRSFGERLSLIFPTGILYKSGFVYVVDHSRNSNKVYKLGKEGQIESEIPREGRGRLKLNQPKAVAVDGRGDLFICDRGSDRLVKVSGRGKFLAEVSLVKTAPSPNGIAITKKGEIFITSKNKNQIYHLETDGKVQPVVLRDSGGNPQELDNPSSLEAADNGVLYVCDTGNRRVLSFHPDGRIVDNIDRDVISDLEDFMPMGIALDRENKHLYIVGSNRLNYRGDECPDCLGKIWRIEI